MALGSLLLLDGPVLAAGDIVIDGDFSDWCNGVGLEFCVDDQGGADDWGSPSRLDITEFGVASDLVDTFYVLMGFDDTPVTPLGVACMLIDSPPANDLIDFVLCSTIDPGGVDAVELYSCDDTIPAGCGSAALIKTYPPADYGFSDTVIGPFGNPDSFIEIRMPWSDLGAACCDVIVGALISYPGPSFLTIPKDSIFGTTFQDYDSRILCNLDDGNCTIISGPATSTITGIVYADEGTTAIAPGTTVRLLVNGVDVGSDTTDAVGTYFISVPVPISAGDAILVYIDGGPSTGTAVTVVNGPNLTDLDIYADHVLTRHDNGGSLSNSDMATAKAGFSDADILYSVSAGNLTVSGSDTELYVLAGYGFTPSGDVTTPSMESLGAFDGGIGTIDINGTLTLSGGSFTATSGTMSIAGDLARSAGAFAHNSGTVTLDGTAQTISGSTSFFNLTKSVAAADTLTFEATSTQTITGTVTFGGAAANLLSLVSGTPGTRWSLNMSAGATKAIFYVDVQDSDASGSDTSQTPINPSDSVNSGNNIDWFGPELVLQKNVATIDDPVNGVTNPKAIPGANVQYTIRLTNQGPGAVDTDTVVISDPFPPDLELFVNGLGAPGSGPVEFIDGSPVSGLTYTFGGLGDGTDDLEFDDGSLNFTYTPVPDVDGYDSSVTAIRANPKGIFDASGGGGDPSFEFRFRMRVR